MSRTMAAQPHVATAGTAPAGGVRRRRASSSRVHKPATRDRSPRIWLLDAFRVTCAGQLLSVPMSAQRLLAFLAMHDESLLRPYVAGMLWPETTEERAQASLRSALWRAQLTGHALVEAQGRRLRLARDVNVDVRELATLARSLHDRTDELPVDGVSRLPLFGDLLPDWYEDWLLIERERVRQLRLHALETLCERLTEAGRLGQALEAGLAALAGDPLRESAHRVLIKVYLAEGNQVDAVRQYRLYRTLLWERLRLRPSPQIEALVVPRCGSDRL